MKHYGIKKKRDLGRLECTGKYYTSEERPRRQARKRERQQERKEINMSIRCNNKNCKVSTGICGSLTFGWGELDDNGYWEFPCEECARGWESQFPVDGPCWPFKAIPIDSKLINKIESLVEDVEIDLDKPLKEEDE